MKGMNPFPFVEIKRRIELFKERFTRSFNKKLESIEDIATGVTEAKVEYSLAGGIAKNLGEALINAAGNAIPVVGPFVSGVVTQASVGIYEYYQKREIVQRTAGSNEFLSQLGSIFIKSVIEETAHEIARVFEYQIYTLSGDTEVMMLADFAVQKIFLKASNNNQRHIEQVSFSCRDLIKALVKDENVTGLDKIIEKLFKTHIIKTKDGISWKIYEVFTKPGLRIETINGFDYKTKTASDINYGFRARIFDWNEDSKTYVISSSEAEYVTSAAAQTASAYIPLMRLVSQKELLAYIKQERTKNFNKYFFDDESMRISVFRDITFSDIPDISNRDFSNADLTRIVLSGKQMQETKFENTRLILSRIENSNAEKTELQEADLRWSAIKKVVFKSQAYFMHTKLDFAYIDRETDLTDNHYFDSANHKEAYVECKIKYRRISQIGKIERNFYNAHQTIDNFISRDDILENIYRNFFESTRSVVQIIYALGGMGKTQTSIQFAQKYSKNYNHGVRVFNAETKAALDKDFREFAMLLGLSKEEMSGEKNLAFEPSIKSLDFTPETKVPKDRPSGMSNEDIIKWVKDKLANSIEKSLLIFDNVENGELIRSYLPYPTGRYKHDVIITARDGSIITSGEGREIKAIQLNRLTEKEAIDHIISSLPGTSLEQAKALADKLDLLPINLATAISAIKHSDIDVEEYLTNYVTSLEKYDGVSSSLKIISSSFPNALTILRILSYLASDQIPESIFDNLFSERLAKKAALSKLEAMSLVSIRDNLGVKFISIHRVIQDKVKESLNKQESISVIGQAMMLIDKKFEQAENLSEQEKAKLHKQLLIHALSLIEPYKEYDSLNSKATAELSAIASPKHKHAAAEIASNMVIDQPQMNWFFKYLLTIWIFKYFIELIFKPQTTKISIIPDKDRHSAKDTSLCNSAEDKNPLDIVKNKPTMEPNLNALTAKLYRHCGVAYLGISRYEDAERYLKKALEKARQFFTSEKTLIAYILVELAEAEIGINELDEPERNALEALRILSQENGKDLTKIAKAHLCLGKVLMNNKPKYLRCLERCKEGYLWLEKNRQPGGEVENAESLTEIQNSLKKILVQIADLQKELKPALKEFETAKEIYNRLEDKLHEAETLVLMADVQQALEMDKESKASYLEAIGLFNSIGAEISVARTSIKYNILLENFEGIESIESAVKILEAAEENFAYEIGIAYISFSQLKMKSDLYEDAFNLVKKAKSKLEFIEDHWDRDSLESCIEDLIQNIIDSLLDRAYDIAKNYYNRGVVTNLFGKLRGNEKKKVIQNSRGDITKAKVMFEYCKQEGIEYDSYRISRMEDIIDSFEKAVLFVVKQLDYHNPILNIDGLITKAYKFGGIKLVNKFIDSGVNPELAKQVAVAFSSNNIEQATWTLFANNDQRAINFFETAKHLLPIEQYQKLITLFTDDDVAEQIIEQLDFQLPEQILEIFFGKIDDPLVKSIETIKSFFSENEMHEIQGLWQSIYNSLSNNYLSKSSSQIIESMGGLIRNIQNLLDYSLVIPEGFDMNDQISSLLEQLHYLLEYVGSTKTPFIIPRPPFFNPDDDDNGGSGGGGSSGENRNQTDIVNETDIPIFLIGVNISEPIFS